MFISVVTGDVMTFDELKTEFDLLLARLGDQPADRHELEELLREKINALKAFGLPLPRDLLELDASLGQDFVDEARQNARLDKTKRE